MGDNKDKVFCWWCSSHKGPVDEEGRCVNKDACMARMALQDDDYPMDKLDQILSRASE